MAFPSIRSSNANSVAGQTGIAVPMPGTIVAGDLLLCYIRGNVDAVITSAPSGFTLVVSNTGPNQVTYLYKKIAVGGDTATFNADKVNGWSIVTAAIQGWAGTLADIEANPVSITNNPPLLVASWGSDDNLFVIGAGGRAGTLPAISAWSTNYAEIAQTTGDFGTDVCGGLASRQLAADSDNPDAVTFSGSPTTVTALTAVVKPATAQNIAIGQAVETETANTITPLISRVVAVGQASETETANAITPAVARTVDVGQAVERELAQAITPVIGRMVAIGQATEVEIGQPIAPVRGVAVGRASEVELARLISPVKPIFVPLQTAVERELAQIITPTKQVPGQLGPAVCEVVSPSAECETFAL